MHLAIYMPQRFFLFTAREAGRLVARLDVPKFLTCAYDVMEKRICCYVIFGSYSGVTEYFQVFCSAMLYRWVNISRRFEAPSPSGSSKLRRLFKDQGTANFRNI